MALAQLSSSAVYPARSTALGAEVLRGLAARPKTLSPWLFYDAKGSALFEQITSLPEYYVTRTERAIFTAHAGEIVRHAAGNRPLAVVELGAGTAAKTGLLLESVAARQGSVEYYPIDVSESALLEAREHLERECANVHVYPRVGDYTEGLGQIDIPGMRRLVLYIGSSIGNFEPDDAAELLSGLRAQLAPGDQLLLGADQVKDAAALLAAYDDSQGITAAFNRNVLHRINRELEANFEPWRFIHEARWNSRLSRIEMHLCSEGDQTVHIAALGITLDFAAGETIHTENSYKFTDPRITDLLSSAGFGLRRTWKDNSGWFGVYLAEVL